MNLEVKKEILSDIIAKTNYWCLLKYHKTVYLMNLYKYYYKYRVKCLSNISNWHDLSLQELK